MPPQVPPQMSVSHSLPRLLHPMSSEPPYQGNSPLLQCWLRRVNVSRI